ncbi:hypothetical protein FACS189437_04190 [Bacteroidia bacterium]|nr:hypothetical protein FACS189437_04190 [Bacteroidia bacterium]
MDFNLYLSDQYRIDYHRITDYLFITWGVKSVVKFEKIVQKILLRISQMPTIGTEVIVNERVLREISLTKQNKLIYEIKETQVILIKIFDTRQHPDKRYNF